MIDTGDLRKGLTIELDGNLYSIVDWEHNKTGRGGAVVRLKLRDVRAGHIFERTWPAGSRFQRARVERQPAQYLYADGDILYFMNKETFDQIPMNRDKVGDMVNYLKENEDCQVLTYGEEAISVELPAAVVLTVAETEPGLRGDTAQGGTKPARMETGLVVNVPLFVNTGDKLKIDTRSGAYLERAN
ncbi:MAG TPA: elongation factor P [Dehalococcoidia bacterium]|nr:elongation factor P [Dehalococcoidia bacterium]